MKAQILIFVLFLLLMVALMAGGLSQMWETEVGIPTLQEHGLRAFYLAQAGIERAKIEVLNDVNLAGDSAWDTGLDIADDNYTFRYNFNVAIAGAQRTLIGRGEVLDINNNLLAHREITVTIDGVLDEPPLDGRDDDNTATLDPWSWQEI